MLPENEDAWDIWCDIGTQWIASGFGLIGLMRSEVRASAERHGIDLETSESTLSKIKTLERLTLNSQRKDDGDKG